MMRDPSRTRASFARARRRAAGGVLVAAVTVAGSKAAAAPPPPDAVRPYEVKITADNAYALYTGSGVAAEQFIGGATNFQDINQIYAPETYSFDAPVNNFFYIVAWSDAAVAQGLLAEFTDWSMPPTHEILSGDLVHWRVTSTGDTLSALSSPPTLEELTAQIQAADAGLTPSGGWVTPAISALTNGQGGIHPNPRTVPGIDADARWVWYDSGEDLRPGAPFKGFDHGEYLIFEVGPVEPIPVPPAALIGLLPLGAVAYGHLRRRRQNATL